MDTFKHGREQDQGGPCLGGQFWGWDLGMGWVSLCREVQVEQDGTCLGECMVGYNPSWIMVTSHPPLTDRHDRKHYGQYSATRSVSFSVLSRIELLQTIGYMYFQYKFLQLLIFVMLSKHQDVCE